MTYLFLKCHNILDINTLKRNIGFVAWSFLNSPEIALDSWLLENKVPFIPVLITNINVQVTNYILLSKCYQGNQIPIFGF